VTGRVAGRDTNTVDNAYPLVFRPVALDTRADFEHLFSSPGAPKYCWCMVWRRTAAEARDRTGAGHKHQMMRRIEAGVPVGILAYSGGTPVAWVSVAPRDTYRDLGGPPAGADEVIWSIACFFVLRRLRGRGILLRLIAAAVDHARRQGASIVEAYPVDADAPSYRFMGFVPVFARAGFTEVARAGTRRHVMRLDLV